MKFVFDLDGTICFKGQPVSEEILTCLNNLENEGHEVIFASARPIRDMLPVLHSRFHQHTLIGGNGSLISQNGKLVYAKEFDQQTLTQILSFIKKYGATYLIDSDWDYAYTGPIDHPILLNVDADKLANCVSVGELRSIVKILLLTAADMEQLAEQLHTLPVVVHTHRNENVLDVSPQHIDKWNALQTLGVKAGEYIAFGNDANDISMFKHALHTVMIGNHVDLAPHAKDSIVLDELCEKGIIDRLKELAKEYRVVISR
ncbi:HAD-IIB family hydrolase [Priestia taiwanensis]|uniref:Hydrolase n=1 Tax=Priestia taiwanensis TaxID=1347902 RepID=A0A917APC5_9BACI|nr:HAD-IIB family hydrolase [Priestia taiwanensis]MBM7362635.1 Cof subfamily protein (haloacid dehalogenase superfamily) [Priestia taiwanensis]GGE63851.1 hydrolase [Priestia taiwanensis]